MSEAISVVMITRNAAQTLAWCLESLKDFSEVVIYDNGSQDATLEIANSYPNVKLHQGEFLGFGESKNYAISLASNDWILSIDADEAPDEALLQAVLGLQLNDVAVVYEVLRDNYFMGQPVRYGGWGGDWLVRLFNRKQQVFTDAKVHERVNVSSDARVVRLSGYLCHQAVNDVGQFLQKISFYSGLKRKKAKRAYPVPIIMMRAGWAFFRSYVLKLGMLAGWRGVVIAVSNANGVFYKYMKVYSQKKS
jgi:glycosyltransferase involved in cell wall biosynthesis